MMFIIIFPLLIAKVRSISVHVNVYNHSKGEKAKMPITHREKSSKRRARQNHVQRRRWSWRRESTLTNTKVQIASGDGGWVAISSAAIVKSAKLAGAPAASKLRLPKQAKEVK